jgi:hypothetical protein
MMYPVTDAGKSNIFFDMMLMTIHVMIGAMTINGIHIITRRRDVEGSVPSLNADFNHDDNV